MRGRTYVKTRGGGDSNPELILSFASNTLDWSFPSDTGLNLLRHDLQLVFRADDPMRDRKEHRFVPVCVKNLI